MEMCSVQKMYMFLYVYWLDSFIFDAKSDFLAEKRHFYLISSNLNVHKKKYGDPILFMHCFRVCYAYDVHPNEFTTVCLIL